MTKKPKKPKLVVDNKRPAQKPPYEEKSSSVYVFNNIIFNFSMYITASTADEAMERFDQCGFIYREHWKIMVELSHQPSEVN